MAVGKQNWSIEITPCSLSVLITSVCAVFEQSTPQEPDAHPYNIIIHIYDKELSNTGEINISCQETPRGIVVVVGDFSEFNSKLLEYRHLSPVYKFIECGEEVSQTVGVDMSSLSICRPDLEVFMEFTCLTNNVDKSAGIPILSLINKLRAASSFVYVVCKRRFNWAVCEWTKDDAIQFLMATTRDQKRNDSMWSLKGADWLNTSNLMTLVLRDKRQVKWNSETIPCYLTIHRAVFCHFKNSILQCCLFYSVQILKSGIFPILTLAMATQYQMGLKWLMNCVH